MRKIFYSTILAFLAVTLLHTSARAQVLITESGSCNFVISTPLHDFNSLTGASWSNNATLTGWYLSDPAAFQTGISDGSSPAGGFYVFADSPVSADKALGTIASGGAGDLYIGLRLQNNTTKHIYNLVLQYSGEQWREGQNGNNVNGYTVYWRTSPTAITSVPPSNPNGNGYSVALRYTAPYDTVFNYDAGLNNPNCGGGGTAVNGSLNTTPAGPGVILDFAADPIPPGGEIMILWEDLNNSCADHGLAIDDVNLNFAFGTPVGDTLDPIVGQDTVCQNTTHVYTSGSAPPGATILWDVNMPAGTYTIDSVGRNTNPQFIFNNVPPGDYVITAVSQTACGGGSQSQNFDVTVLTEPAAADAGLDQVFCFRDSTRLFGNNPGTNLGQWNSVSGPVGPTVVSPNSPSTDVLDMLLPGLYEFEWTITNTSCNLTNRDTVLVNILAPTTTANAGADNSFCGGSAIALAGNAPGAGETGSWAVVPTTPAPPSAPIITGSGAIVTVVGVTPGFVYNFEYIISKPGCPDSRDTVQYTVAAPTTTANAGVDQTVCATGSLTLSGNAINASTETAGWSFISGPATPTVTMTSATNATVSGITASGAYVFRYTINNPPCPPSTDDVTLTAILPPAPAPNAGGDQFLCGATSITLNGNAVTNGTNSWRFYNTTTSTTPTLAPVGNDLNVTGMTENGVYRFIYSFQNPPCTALEDTVEVTVSDETVPGTISGPTEFCGNGLVNLLLTGNLGQVLRWEKSTDGFATVTNIANTTTTLIDFISQTTQYRAVVQNPGCGIELTAPFRVRIDQPSQGGTLNFYQYSSNNICGSNISGVLYVTGAFGNVEHWEYFNSKTSAWDTIPNGNYYLNVPNDLPFSLFDTTSFRVSVKSGICPSVYSNVNIVEPKVQGLDFDTLYAVSGCDGYAAIKAEAGNGSGDYDYFISPSAGFQQSPGFFNYVQTNRTYTVYARDRNTLCYTQKTITVTPASVQPPQVFSARNVTSNSAVIEWLRVPGFNVTYELWYRKIGPITPTNKWKTISVGTTVSYRIAGLDPGTKYVFRIRAICRDGSQSTLSAVAERPEARFTTLAGRSVALNDEGALNTLSVYPNPNNGAFTLDIEANNGGAASFTLTDVAGKRVHFQKLQVEAGRNEIPVSLDRISSGVYILRYQQGKTVKAVKLIVE